MHRRRALLIALLIDLGASGFSDAQLTESSTFSTSRTTHSTGGVAHVERMPHSSRPIITVVTQAEVQDAQSASQHSSPPSPRLSDAQLLPIVAKLSTRATTPCRKKHSREHTFFRVEALRRRDGDAGETV